jgi:hypothetical protein
MSSAGNDAETMPAELGLPAPSLNQLRACVRHIRNHLNRDLETLDRESGVAAAIRRARIFEGHAALELAIAEMQAHPDWRRV